MNYKKYKGLFISTINVNNYSLEVLALNYIEAFILLTADAIRANKQYQLDTITDTSTNETRYISNITNISKLIN